MAYLAAIVGLGLCAQGLFRIWVGIKVYRDELAKRNPSVATRYFGLAFVSGWGAFMVGTQILLLVFWSLRMEGSAPLWPGVAGVISLGIALAWGFVMRRTAG